MENLPSGHFEGGQNLSEGSKDGPGPILEVKVNEIVSAVTALESAPAGGASPVKFAGVALVQAGGIVAVAGMTSGLRVMAAFATNPSGAIISHLTSATGYIWIEYVGAPVTAGDGNYIFYMVFEDLA